MRTRYSMWKNIVTCIVCVLLYACVGNEYCDWWNNILVYIWIVSCVHVALLVVVTISMFSFYCKMVMLLRNTPYAEVSPRPRGSKPKRVRTLLVITRVLMLVVCHTTDSPITTPIVIGSAEEESERPGNVLYCYLYILNGF